MKCFVLQFRRNYQSSLVRYRRNCFIFFRFPRDGSEDDNILRHLFLKKKKITKIAANFYKSL